MSGTHTAHRSTRHVLWGLPSRTDLNGKVCTVEPQKAREDDRVRVRLAEDGTCCEPRAAMVLGMDEWRRVVKEEQKRVQDLTETFVKRARIDEEEYAVKLLEEEIEVAKQKLKHAEDLLRADEEWHSTVNHWREVLDVRKAPPTTSVDIVTAEYP